MLRRQALMIIPFTVRKGPIAAIVIGALIAVLLSTQTKANPPTDAPLTEQVQSTQGELKEVSAHIKKLKKLITKLSKQRSQTEKQLALLETDISDKHKAIRKQETLMSATQAELKGLAQQMSALVEAKKQSENTIEQGITQAYQISSKSSVNLFLNQQDPSESVRELTYFRYYIEAHKSQLEQHEMLLNEITTVETQLKQKLAEEKSITENLKQQNAEIIRQQKNRSQKLAKLKRDEASHKGSLNKFQRKRKELNAVLAILNKRIVAQKSSASAVFSKQKGKLLWPIAPKHQGQAVFNRDRSGLSITTAPYSPVRAIFQGEVVFADWLRGYGLLVIVQHDDDYLSLYAHNSVIEKNVGDKVSAGETIARVGDNIGSDQAKLYFELRRSGKSVNPKLWLAKHR